MTQVCSLKKMKNISITGIDGLIGSHLRAFLYGQPDVQLNGANRATFASENNLEKFVSASDAIVHLAGLHCGDEQLVAETNIRLTKALISACKQVKKRPHIIFASSTHIYRDTLYGHSKKECSRLLQHWADSVGASFTNLILPHVFGEGGKPFFNSVISTFCYQIANGQKSEIIKDSEVEELHAQRLAWEIFDIICACRLGDVTPKGTKIMVSDLLAKLKDFNKKYQQQIIPNLSNAFDLHLFNTFRSYLFPKKYPIAPVLHTDTRGTLFESIKALSGGQTYNSTTKPGITRGNHYHLTKLERFLVLSGQADICLRKLFSNEVITFRVNGDEPGFIDIPNLYAHNITNTGRSDLLTLFWSHEIFDPEHPDTYPEEV